MPLLKALQLKMSDTIRSPVDHKLYFLEVWKKAYAAWVVSNKDEPSLAKRNESYEALCQWWSSEEDASYLRLEERLASSSDNQKKRPAEKEASLLRLEEGLCQKKRPPEADR